LVSNFIFKKKHALNRNREEKRMETLWVIFFLASYEDRWSSPTPQR